MATVTLKLVRIGSGRETLTSHTLFTVARFFNQPASVSNRPMNDVDPI